MVGLISRQKKPCFGLRHENQFVGIKRSKPKSRKTFDFYSRMKKNFEGNLGALIEGWKWLFSYYDTFRQTEPNRIHLSPSAIYMTYISVHGDFELDASF
jgi:hypothetical protein